MLQLFEMKGRSRGKFWWGVGYFNGLKVYPNKPLTLHHSAAGGKTSNYTMEKSDNSLTEWSKLTSHWGSDRHHVPAEVSPQGHSIPYVAFRLRMHKLNIIMKKHHTNPKQRNILLRGGGSKINVIKDKGCKNVLDQIRMGLKRHDNWMQCLTLDWILHWRQKCYKQHFWVNWQARNRQNLWRIIF